MQQQYMHPTTFQSAEQRQSAKQRKAASTKKQGKQRGGKHSSIHKGFIPYIRKHHPITRIHPNRIKGCGGALQGFRTTHFPTCSARRRIRKNTK
ncbi:hypothetical protein AVEN_159443-1 [Araneus ventricosus]|uniref:Uncharacterized protein n=1 Tax=Araneus ventricosus TaxID=182803 RepID=A0A4Y2A222_ARAVE|nr:hypothetical protein AVEN_159443-1 [Araneus ventricosus]